MMLFKNLISILAAASTVAAVPTQSLDFSGLATRANANLKGYLGVFFLGSEPNVYFYRSNGNNGHRFSALNGGNAILKPTATGGTGGARDPSIISSPDGKKWYIIATDLDIAKTTWADSQRTGSLGMYIWESTDLVNWTNERLVKVESDNAGMVWAPDALWDDAKGQYLVHWSARIYADSDTGHTGTATPNLMRYAYTSDFKTFTAPKTLIDKTPTSIIDLAYLPLGNNKYARFLKNETATNVYMERSDDGLFGTWTRPGGNTAIIRSGVEGPYAYWDNVADGKVTLLLDYFGGDGYAPFDSTDLNVNDWTAADKSGFPKGLRHGSVVGITQAQYDALGAAFP